ncbi:hypothetical protein U1Q18_049110 [Sarracenia purpurea var. burkii]
MRFPEQGSKDMLQSTTASGNEQLAVSSCFSVIPQRFAEADNNTLNVPPPGASAPQNPTNVRPVSTPVSQNPPIGRPPVTSAPSQNPELAQRFKNATATALLSKQNSL